MIDKIIYAYTLYIILSLMLWFLRKHLYIKYITITFIIVTVLLMYLLQTPLSYVVITLLMAFLVINLPLIFEKRSGFLKPIDQVLVLTVLIGLIVILLGKELVEIIIGFIISTLPIGLLIPYRGGVIDLDSAVKYLVFSSIGFSLLIVGICIGIALPIYLPLAIVLIIAGLGFELGFVPFHAWIPDVYSRSEPLVIALLASLPKVSTIAVMIKILIITPGIIHSSYLLRDLLAVISFITMTLGNVGALMSKEVSRVLAYSTIAQMGYACIALTGLPTHYLFAASAALYQTIANAIAKFSLFTALTSTSDTEFYKSSIYVSNLSLIGIPPTLGFWAKLWLFQLAIMTNQYWLGIALVINTAISVPYYIRITRELTKGGKGDIMIITVVTITSMSLIILGVTIPTKLLEILTL